VTKHLNSAKKPREEGEGRCSRAVAIMVVPQLGQKTLTTNKDKYKRNGASGHPGRLEFCREELVRTLWGRVQVESPSKLSRDNLNSNSFPTPTALTGTPPVPFSYSTFTFRLSLYVYYLKQPWCAVWLSWVDHCYPRHCSPLGVDLSVIDFSTRLISNSFDASTTLTTCLALTEMT